MYVADDFVEGCIQYFANGQYTSMKVAVFDIRDDSTPLESIFTINVHISIQSKYAESIADHIKSNYQNLLLAMRIVSGGRYKDVDSIRLSYDPVVINHPKEKWEVVLQVVVVCLVAGLLITLIWVKRKNIASVYHRLTSQYRHRRRVAVLEELGLPVDMTYIPRDTGNPDVQLFETPYGNICLVKPLVPSIPRLEGNFVEASSICWNKKETIEYKLRSQALRLQLLRHLHNDFRIDRSIVSIQGNQNRIAMSIYCFI